MTLLNIPLADWWNGLIMIGVFVLVVVILVVMTISFLSKGNKKDE